MRRAVIVLAVLATGCGAAERQDADEPSGEFKVQIVSATFPKRQHIAESVQLRVRVKNADDETLRNVAVTVETKPVEGNAAISFGQRSNDPALADSGRPIWVLDAGPVGGDVVTVNTWSAGTLGPGESKVLVWKLVASRAGRFTVDYRVSPGLTGRATAAQGDTSGSFDVTIADLPVPARVGADGRVTRAALR
ncbi:hypothetical protein OM076_21175 [Solirubrobacter ginsenosidimutans]|uniref:Uncharacterized protein n=1 Tax=Solirubrobacter ginsenosidimutans TaxID=490573 RepID=A0A9X3MU94_9ACTN|nr:hypothetical protein [Solirubrobacter ginsenosidimutans]MDA0162799.1 hypothetical protein [Solirubrobacter ginsenosidimutans]